MNLQLRAVDLAALSSRVYTGYGAAPPGYAQVDTIEIAATSTYAELWRAPLREGQQIGDLVIVFRGTRPGDQKDIAADTQIMAGQIPDAAAAALAEVLDNQAYKDQIDAGGNIVFSGHSLGGYLAQYVGAKIQSDAYVPFPHDHLPLYAVTFDAPALPSWLLSGTQATFDHVNFYSQADPVTNMTLLRGGMFPGENVALPAGPGALSTSLLCNTATLSAPFSAQEI